MQKEAGGLEGDAKDDWRRVKECRLRTLSVIGALYRAGTGPAAELCGPLVQASDLLGVRAVR